MLNDIRMTVSGNVTREPEVKYRRSDGRPFAVVPIAVNERRFDPATQQYVQAGVTYYDIICPGSLGANALHSLAIGTPVVAHGRFSVHEWTSETARGARPQVRADSIGVDLTWGTTSYTKGSRGYPELEDEYGTATPPQSEGGPADRGPSPDFIDEDDDLPAGLTVDANGEVHGEAHEEVEEEPSRAA
ncbi:single-stranded DNA-binding protein [Ornithinimicrobium avium]|uniref:Single-stranded DNA-binding protein n=1 Tax=Ornithinimicrobium avium TaxID=2283195 RepID=A0A345NLM7_9MICO|nr:single-stranded DNA-binding protein [Ornithinimicrobium avium]AXH95935.1 single-stranded DNA-binding protein [Ornithinimicrobium avium]